LERKGGNGERGRLDGEGTRKKARAKITRRRRGRGVIAEKRGVKTRRG
jgi:hypothetical protein